MPGGSGEETTQGRDDQAVARAPGDPLGAAPQDPHFVAKDEQLKIAGGAAAAPEQGEVEEQTDDGIQER
ncbi:MAG TPA: hypothetical protein VII06_26915 [Chloroflexota bacterium]